MENKGKSRAYTFAVHINLLSLPLYCEVTAQDLNLYFIVRNTNLL